VKSLHKRLGILVAGVSLAAGIDESHRRQLNAIHLQCVIIRTKSHSLLAPEEDIESVLKALNTLKEKNWDDEGGLKFITGDFDIDDGKTRCGGIAHEICRKLSSCGFDTTIGLEFFHYYAVVRKGDRSWKIKGSPPDLYAEE